MIIQIQNRLLALLCFICHISYSQNFEWLNYTSNNQSEIIKDMVVDENENIIQLIQTTPKIVNQAQLLKLFKIRKINTSGVELWTKSLNVQDVVSLDTDSNGNVFLLGCSNGTTDMNPDPQINNNFFTNNSGAGFGNNEALFVLKLTNTGVFQNFATIGAYPNCNGNDGCAIKSYPIQLKIDYNDNVIFTFKPRSGGFIDIDPSTNVQNIATTSINYFTMIKWSNNLDSLLWVNYLYGQQEELLQSDNIDITPKAIFFDIDNNNNVYVATLNVPDVFLSKYSSNGTLLNNPTLTKITSYKHITLGDLNVLSDNEIIIGGQFINYIDVNPILSNSSQVLTSTYPIITETGRNLTDSFIVKYDSNFNVIWKNKISSYFNDEIEDIETYNGKIFVLGTSRDYIFANFRWTEAKSFLKVLNQDGTIFIEKPYISPYPEIPVSSSGALDIFLSPFKEPYYFNSSNITLLDWCKRNIAIKNQKIYISGEYSACGTNQQRPFSLYTSPNYSSSFDWDICSIIPPNHQTGINTIPITWLIRPYTAKYNLLECSNLSQFNNLNTFENQTIIFPNPTKGELNINSDLRINKIEIYNLLGQLILVKIINNYSEVINMENISVGEYYLKVYHENIINTSKFIKK